MGWKLKGLQNALWGPSWGNWTMLQGDYCLQVLRIGTERAGQRHLGRVYTELKQVFEQWKMQQSQWVVLSMQHQNGGPARCRLPKLWGQRQSELSRKDWEMRTRTEEEAEAQARRVEDSFRAQVPTTPRNPSKLTDCDPQVDIFLEKQKGAIDLLDLANKFDFHSKRHWIIIV